MPYTGDTMDTVDLPPVRGAGSAESLLPGQIRTALLWRSGSQIVAQLIQWAATFAVIRILVPADYGLFAMGQVVIAFLAMLDGYGLANGLIRQKTVEHRDVRQLFGMLIVLNLALAIGQLALAPWAAAYYRQPIVGDMLRVQAVLHLTTPFIVLPYALLARTMDFRHQAKANVVASVASAITALGGALYGLGIWTLVLAPIVLFGIRGAMMTWGARSLVWPSFDFRGAGPVARYGGMMAAGQLCLFLQSQADVAIAGRSFSAHMLGIYTTSLFLAQIFVAKFVPPLNEVAFSAYARMHHEPGAIGRAFVKGLRMVMIVAMPVYMGLAATAEPLVLTILGEKWHEMAPVVRLLALAMPFMTVQILLVPASDACGRPGIGVQNGAVGALILTIAFLAGAQWGPIGLGAAWIAAYPVYLAISAWRTLPVIGVSLRDFARAVAPPALAAIAMALINGLIDRGIRPLGVPLRLTILVMAGASIYAAWLYVFSRPAIRDLMGVVRRQPVRDQESTSD